MPAGYGPEEVPDLDTFYAGTKKSEENIVDWNYSTVAIAIINAAPKGKQKNCCWINFVSKS